MRLGLKALTALAEDPGFNLRTHNREFVTAYNSRFRASCVSYWLLWALQAYSSGARKKEMRRRTRGKTKENTKANINLITK